MTKEQVSLIISFVSMAFNAGSYFAKKKTVFLLMQATGIILLMGTFLLTAEYSAMVGLGIGLGRVLTYFFFEQKQKKPSVFWPILFSGLSVIAYVIIDWIILKNAGWYNVFYLIGLVLYAFVFWIRDLKVMRHAAPAPTMFSVAYCVLSGADIFVIIAYSLELCANIVSLVKYHVYDKKIVVKEKKDEQLEQQETSEDSAVDTLG